MTGSVALIGLGAIGEPMARALVMAGFDVTVHTRTAAKAERFAEQTGAGVATTPAAAAAVSPIVLTVLPDLPDVVDVLEGDDGLIAGWAQAGTTDPVLVVMGTVSAVQLRALARELAERGIEVLDAPVSGGVRGAQEARLSIMVGGRPEVFERVRPAFEAMGSVVRLLGPSGSGSTAKLCNQLVVASTLTALAESMVLAERSGLDLALLQELLKGGLADSEVLRQKGHHWLEENYEPGGSAAYQLKDLDYALGAALDAGLDLTVAGAVQQRFRELVRDDGEGALDHSAVIKGIRRRAGAPYRP